MAKSRKSKKSRKIPRINPIRFLRRWGLRFATLIVVVIVGVVVAHRWMMPPETYYMGQEEHRLGKISYRWVSIDEVAPVMARSIVAAEDANFCNHWGFDMNAIRDAIEDGGGRGASTLSQQTVKNTYLWHGRSWLRKALEALMTPLVELAWDKRRIVEVYMNVAEFDEGVFGVGAASRHYFDVAPSKLTARHAALLAAVLPDPKGRSAKNPSAWMKKRASSIMDGAATIDRDGRADCFED
ncbi:monofunctional biosynthetic peptidoglycan transglycosylase [Roseovarius sp. EL26]|uniref:monofunctional biosynthetic peptidoglycan transglycosylase n=1 Tax=Roseovarius sp. EL26 TaxID=2126672 RepID=UPI000EA2D3EF|nr:monofunctional biosynthetic peptidoglycan transglycosylase [Roseovarius sp. EL26]